VSLVAEAIIDFGNFLAGTYPPEGKMHDVDILDEFLPAPFM
jgi:hypothetical protein